MYISGIAGTEAETHKQYVNLSFSSKVYNMPEFNVRSFILPKVTYELPTLPVNPSGWNHATDEFKFTVEPLLMQTVTKRSVLSQIAKEVIPPQSWHHVKGSENPVDLPSRGVAVEELLSSSLWFHGPTFLLTRDSAFTPETTLSDGSVKTALEEERKNVIVNVHIKYDTFLIQQYSSLGRLQRITALIQRFWKNLKAKHEGRIRMTGPLTVVELSQALLSIIFMIQRNEYSTELQELEENKSVGSRSKIHPLSPMLSQDGLLRVGGTLRKSHLPYNYKHPILLPRNHKLTRLIVEDAHRYLAHGGAQLVLFTVQQRYWIIRRKELVRSIIRKCKPCVIHRAQATTQKMADLTIHRVTPSQPFSHVGIDYAGPVILRNMLGRKSQQYKAYIALFVCFSTTAIHLELVSDLSSAAFIAALHRFTARRGKPQCIFSDNGTNFVGANKELKEFLRLIRTQEHNHAVSHDLSRDGIQWVFNTPAAPHMGGLWESGVKSVKHHLRRTLGDTPLTFEEYATLLSQVESCLNSRPLCPASADPNDLTSLSPGHFLIGAPLQAIPEPNLTILNVNRLSRWQHLQ
ncbi:unnamed protein product, partial [Allacma fusca]